MAINPLFSGPGQGNKIRRPSIRVRSSPGNGTAMQPSSKKPRIMQGVQSEKDPFQDFEESFTVDDLEQIDYIESQALSQMPKEESTQQNVAASVSTNGGRKTSSDESSGYESMTQGNNPPRSFSFKPLGSRSPNVPVKLNNNLPAKFPNKQTVVPNQFGQMVQPGKQANMGMKAAGYSNVTGHYGPSRTYVGFQPSQGGISSSPPISSSQKRYKKGCESQPSSRVIQHPKQSVSVPLRNQDPPRSQGFCVSDHNQDFHGSSTSGKQQSMQGSSGIEMRFNLSMQTLHQGAAPNTPTPQTGSFPGTQDLPVERDEVNGQAPEFVLQENEKLKDELKKLRAERYSKDGEIQVLRQNLGKTKTEVSRMKMEKVELEERWRREQNDKEKDLVKELESLKTQLQFKERELAEAQGSYRNLEQRLQTNGPLTAVRNPISPPRSSPRFAGSNLPKRAADMQSPKQEGGFPTKESFMESNPAIGSPNRVKMRLVEERGSPRSPKRVASRSPARSPKVSMTTRRRMERMKAPRRDVSASPRFTLSSRYPQGHVSSAQLIGRLLEQSCPQSYNYISPSQGSLISTLHLHSRNLRDESETDINSRLENAAENINKSSNSNYALALRAISSLLNSTSANQSEYPHFQMEESLKLYSATTTLDNSTGILGVLPLLEEQLTEYLDALHSQMNFCGSSSASTCPTTSSSSGIRGTESSLESGAKEELMQFERVEMGACSALQNIESLTSLSPVVCHHIIRSADGLTRSGQRTSDDGDTSIMDIDPSAPLIDPTQAPRPSTSLQSSSVQQQSPPSSELPHCNMLSKLIRIVGVQPSEGTGAVIANTSLRIVLTLAKSCPAEEIGRFSELISSEVLHQYLSSDSSITTLCLVISILTVLSKSWKLVQMFCTNSDTCLLLQVYQCASNGMTNFRQEERRELVLKIINLLTNIASHHEDGAPFLLDTDCQCSEEVVSSVVLMLFREFRAVDPDSSYECPSLDVVRRGLLPLHSLYMDGHRLEAEHQYNHLIAEMNRLVSRLPNIHRHEVAFLQDFDGSEEEEEDSQETATQMDVS